MAESTRSHILLGGTQEASLGFADRGARYRLILGDGSPAGGVQPWVGAAIGSEHKDCAVGEAYVKAANNGESADWTSVTPAPLILSPFTKQDSGDSADLVSPKTTASTKKKRRRAK